MSDMSDTTPRIVIRKGAFNLERRVPNFAMQTGGSVGGWYLTPRGSDVGVVLVEIVVPPDVLTDAVE